MSDRPLIILGIDALDWGWVDSHRHQLPNLAGWPVVSPLQSIFPPDSIPAWTTIFTGRGPADHGYLDSIDYLDEAPDTAATTAASALPHNTFWDEASRQGLKVCVVNPFLAYPAWEVNGVMIAGPVFVDGSASITGIDEGELPPLPQLGGIVTFPTRKTVGPFVEQTLRRHAGAGGLRACRPGAGGARPVLHQPPHRRSHQALPLALHRSRRPHVSRAEPAREGDRAHVRADRRDPRASTPSSATW